MKATTFGDNGRDFPNTRELADGEPNFVAWQRFLGEGAISLSLRTGLSQRIIRGIVHGQIGSGPSRRKAERLAAELGVDLETLRSRHPREVPALAEEAARRCAWRRLDIPYRKLGPAKALRAALIEAEALAEPRPPEKGCFNAVRRT